MASAAQLPLSDAALRNAPLRSAPPRHSTQRPPGDHVVMVVLYAPTDDPLAAPVWTRSWAAFNPPSPAAVVRRLLGDLGRRADQVCLGRINGPEPVPGQWPGQSIDIHSVPGGPDASPRLATILQGLTPTGLQVTLDQIKYEETR